jgi:SSS family solute:Na+ symporter
MASLQLTGLDLAIIGIYLVAVTAIGLAMRKRASKSVESYLLGGKDIPWYMLGLSNASGMFDISGTMWLVTIGFVYGLKAIWLPWLWPTFNQVFLMVYLSMWLRRSNVTTGAEWIETRFGTGGGARLSHTVVIVFALIGGLGFLAYGFVGLGKFVEIFIPWEAVQPYLGIQVAPEYVPHLYGIVFTLVAVGYTILGGMRSIVLADVLQFTIMTISAIVVAVIAMTALAANPLVVPDGWMSPFFGWELDLDWTGIITEVNSKIAADQFSFFTIFFMMMVFKGILVSAAGPAPNYDMQKILATRTPREGALMSGFVSLVLSPARYLMITGFVVLGLLFYDRLDLVSGGQVDFEQILPSAINEFVPVGYTGLLLAGLAAAFVSTFSGTLNAAQAYVVNDLYHKYIDPDASERRTVIVNYASGLLIVAVSIVLGFYAKNVNNMLQWIVSGLWGGYLSSNVLKWYWWRFNGQGYFWGMVAGIVPALIAPIFWPNVLPLYYFPHLMGISLVGCLAGTYLTKPTDEATLKSFYRTVRPWGFWGPIRAMVEAENPNFRRNTNFKRDMVNIVVGVIWQTALVVLPIYFVLMQWTPVAVSVVVVIVTMVFLKKNWYDKLENE